MRHDKPLSDDDMEKVRRQWQLVHELSTAKVPNEISIRRAAGLPELPRGTLAHGTRFDLDKMRSIAERGVISGELMGIPEDGETHYCADFFRVPEDMNIGEYVAWYDSLEPQEGTSRITKGRMERNYLARRTSHGEAVTILVATGSPEARMLMEQDAYRDGFESMKTIISYLPIDRNGPRAKRVAAILCGIPASLISGLILPEKITKNAALVLQLRSMFASDVLFFDTDGRELSY